MFTDARSKKVMLVAHCILNQNAKMDRCAYYPGAAREAGAMLVDSGVGLVQLPCPELMCFGLAREADPAIEPTIGEEDTRIARRLQDADAQAICRRLVDDLVYQVEEYAKNGFEVIGILGMNGSPPAARHGGDPTTFGGRSRGGHKPGRADAARPPDAESRRNDPNGCG